MGLVLAAYDARLDRRVAPWLLRHSAPTARAGAGAGPPGARGAGDGAAESPRRGRGVRRRRPRRTARCSSRWSTSRGRRCVSGAPRRPRSWRQVLEHLSCGRAQDSSAAHTAGLDRTATSSPTTCWSAQDGRARVTDFGLGASRPILRGAADERRRRTAGAGRRRPRRRADQSRACWSARLAMASEQLLGGRTADVLTDAFSFCVALYEALYGRYPFAGKTLSRSCSRPTPPAGVRPPPAASDVPAWVARTVLRGLSADRSRRPASMEVVLAELADDPQARRRGRGAGRRAGARCRRNPRRADRRGAGSTRDMSAAAGGMERAARGAWDADTKARVTQALTATGVPSAADTAAARRGAARRLRRCAGAHCGPRCARSRARDPAQPGSLAALRESCLERRRSSPARADRAAGERTRSPAGRPGSAGGAGPARARLLRRRRGAHRRSSAARGRGSARPRRGPRGAGGPAGGALPRPASTRRAWRSARPRCARWSRWPARRCTRGCCS